MKTTKELIIADITAKVEAKLASHKLQLSSLELIKSMSVDSLALYKRGVEWAKEMETFTKKSRELNRQADALSQGLEKELNAFEQQVKALGLNVSTLPEYKKALESLGPLDNIVKMTARFK
jgi:hypothetical protein